MCDWTAGDLLGDWRERVRSELGGLHASDLRVSADGSKATVELKSGAVVASITAWSTGMLELISHGTAGGAASEPDVITEQRDARSQADALLDRWLQRLRRA
jgi:hypothetical protein